MSNDMVTPAQLSYLPGAPFSDNEVDTAVAAVQGAFGWHVAPEESGTVRFSPNAMQRRLILPTKLLVSVDEVRVDGVVYAAENYSVSTELHTVYINTGYWPMGWDNIEVDFTHGYEETPKELLPVIAEAAAMDRRDQSIKPYRLSFDQYDSGLPRRYSLHWISGMA